MHEFRKYFQKFSVLWLKSAIFVTFVYFVEKLVVFCAANFNNMQTLLYNVKTMHHENALWSILWSFDQHGSQFVIRDHEKMNCFWQCQLSYKALDLFLPRILAYALFEINLIKNIIQKFWYTNPQKICSISRMRRDKSYRILLFGPYFWNLSLVLIHIHITQN